MLNLKKIKGTKECTLRYGNLIVCLMLYFLNELPGLGKKQWAHDILVGMQIKKSITGLGTDRDENLWGYFKTFQKNMRQREIISKNIMEKPSTDICFMVKTDETLMEPVEPRQIWITELGYEVDDIIFELYAKMLLDAPLDDKIEHFGTTGEKALEVKTSFNRKRREKKIDKCLHTCKM